MGAMDCIQVQVAREAGFTSIVLDEPNPLDHMTLPLPVQPGPLHIRVRVLQPGGGRSGWSEPRVFDPHARQEPPP
jgi:hypothetical protein